MAAIESFLGAFAAKASAGLPADLRAVQADLRRPDVLRDLGIEIKGRQFLPLRLGLDRLSARLPPSA